MIFIENQQHKKKQVELGKFLFWYMSKWSQEKSYPHFSQLHRTHCCSSLIHIFHLLFHKEKLQFAKSRWKSNSKLEEKKKKKLEFYCKMLETNLCTVLVDHASQPLRSNSSGNTVNARSLLDSQKSLQQCSKCWHLSHC